tara:strand:+ start:156 stop:467 length:312 start_codon:yes stop_codon:yes gene_type:complete
MIKFIHDSWEGVMNADINPLRHIPDLQVRHLAIQLLAWMWCIAFSLYFGSFVVFGYTVVAHFILIIAVVITVVVFQNAEKRKYYHAQGTFKYEETAAKYEDIW